MFKAFFESLHWLTERSINLLRLLVTLAMFSVVIFVLYNAYTSRNTVIVKPFQVPVSMGKDNHEHAGRIIANQLNRHLLETQNGLRDDLNISIDRPVPDEEAILIEGESIRLPETGITIDNVIEFISGIFGRKNLTGAVYFEPHPVDKKDRLFLQLSLRGRVLSMSEDELSEAVRRKLPPTQKNSLNIQLISAMLRERTKEIISIASEDYNLYYYCTRDTGSIEHAQGQHTTFFEYCQQLQDGSATPDTLETLRESLPQARPSDNTTIIGAVIQYINTEITRKQLALCQPGNSRNGNNICKELSVAAASSPRSKAPAPVYPARTASSLNNLGHKAPTTITETDTPINLTEALASPAANVSESIIPGSLDVLAEHCERDQFAASNTAGIVPELEQFCFAPQKQQVQTITGKDILLSNTYEEDAKQQLNNGIFTAALNNFHEAIRLNCNSYAAWANLGVLLSRADKTSEVRDVRQGQCALLRAVQLNSDKFWVWNSLCIAQALEATDNFDQYLDYESCQRASTITPAAKPVNERLFYIEIGNRYLELDEKEQAVQTYVRAMDQEQTRSKSMKRALEALFELADQGVEKARGEACRIYAGSAGTEDKEAREDYEIELDQLAMARCG